MNLSQTKSDLEKENIVMRCETCNKKLLFIYSENINKFKSGNRWRLKKTLDIFVETCKRCNSRSSTKITNFVHHRCPVCLKDNVYSISTAVEGQLEDFLCKRCNSIHRVLIKITITPNNIGPAPRRNPFLVEQIEPNGEEK